MKSRKSYCTTPGVGISGGVSVSKMLKFYVKVFWARRCQASYPVPVTGLVLIIAIKPIALRTAKTLWSFGRSECSRVKRSMVTICNGRKPVYCKNPKY